jgi:hypothetical protein
MWDKISPPKGSKLSKLQRLAIEVEKIFLSFCLTSDRTIDYVLPLEVVVPPGAAIS